MVRVLTENAPGLFSLLRVDDEEDLALLLLLWALAKMGAQSDWEQIAKMN